MRRRITRFLAGLAVGLATCISADRGWAQVNQPPDISLPSPAPDTQPGTPVSFSATVSDPDVGGGNMELEIGVSDLDGVGGLAPADYGSFTWGMGTNVTSDVALASLPALNAALDNFTFTPAPGFAGQARVVFEIDDQGNSGTGGELSSTRSVIIDVCAPSELGTAACATNAAPDISLPGTQAAGSGVSLAIPATVSDVDVGAGLMELEINVSNLDGAGGLDTADYGTFTWSLGSNLTSDLEVRTLAQLNAALATLSFRPNPNFTGLARVVFEIDDQGNSGTGAMELARTRFIDFNVTNTPGQLRFQRGCVLTVGEGTALLVPVERVVGAMGAAAASVGQVADSAVTPGDYTLNANALSWNAGEAGVRNALLTLANDTAAEATERFTLVLGGESGAALTAPSEQLIFVRDVPHSNLIFASNLEGECGG